jgi:hypothetical protein
VDLGGIAPLSKKLSPKEKKARNRMQAYFSYIVDIIGIMIG